MPRIAVILAHPDDESIAIGARMSRYRDATFIHITDGAPVNGADASAHGFSSVDAYRSARVTELRNALLAGGIENPRLRSLNVPDQQASLRLVEITQAVAELLEDVGPEAVLTHPFDGGHPDHDACAFAVHHAIERYEASGHARPVLFEAPFYHASPAGDQAGTFVSLPGDPAEQTFSLSPEEIASKRKILACFTSQRETLKQFPLEQERFRLAPRYDFTQAPHSYGFLYDRFPWGMTSQHFLDLAAAAHAELSRETSLCLELS